MSLNPGNTNINWNYNKPDKPGYTETIVGTVVAMQEVQNREYNPYGNGPGAPSFWDPPTNSRPKMNIRILLVNQMGDLVSFTFQPAGKEARAGKKRSVHMDLYHLTGDTDMQNLIGKTIKISTQQGNWGLGNPRPFDVSLTEDGPFVTNKEIPAEYLNPFLLCDQAVSGGQINTGVAPQNIQPVQPQPVVNTAPVVAQATQPTVVTETAPMPAGMDPNIAQAMQNLGATNVQQVAYDDSIPF